MNSPGSASITMPMPMPSSPRPTAPDTEFSKFFKSEEFNAFNTIHPYSFCMRLDVKRDWNANFAIKDSSNFGSFAAEMEAEVKSLFAMDRALKVKMVHAQKDKLSSRRILLTFAMQTMMRFEIEKFEAIVRKHVKEEEKIVTTRAYLRDFKVRKITDREYDHLLEYGCNPCTTCDLVLKKHRKVNVNHPSVLPDILCFTVVVLSLALAVAILLLIFIK